MNWDLVFKYSQPSGPIIPPLCHPTPSISLKCRWGQNSPLQVQYSCTFDNKFSLFFVAKQGDDNEYFHPCVFFSISSQPLHPHSTHHLKLFVLKLLVWNISHMSIYVFVNLFDFRLKFFFVFFFTVLTIIYALYIIFHPLFSPV